MALAALAAREGDRTRALGMVQELVGTRPDFTSAGGIEVALLRALRRNDDAKKRLLFWRQQDPTSSFLHISHADGRERPGLDGASCRRSRAHRRDCFRLHAPGPLRRCTRCAQRQYPVGPGVVSEPGTADPDSYPLIAYYRGFCRFALG